MQGSHLWLPLPFLSMRKIKTTLYVDGFNLYYGALKSTPYLWLNPVAMASKIFTRNSIVRTKYFSAPVSSMPNDKNVNIRQQDYWNGLKTIPSLEIIPGHFKKREKRAKNVHNKHFTWVYQTEEKGSDVNLASHLLMDAFKGDFDAAIVISGDSDLVSPIRMVKEELRKTVCVLNPQLTEGDYARTRRKQTELKSASSLYKPAIRERFLRNSQMEINLPSANGFIEKPKQWCRPYPATTKTKRA